jgi:hypothetical protein
VKERPIIFSGESVRAILEGRKTQTRRVLRTDPNWDYGIFEYDDKNGYAVMSAVPTFDPMMSHNVKCPYGKPGDRFWVRETWAYVDGEVWYRAEMDWPREDGVELKPAMYMPRWASRLTLEITGLMVERLQEISIDDIFAEGCPVTQDDEDLSNTYQWIADSWDALNDKRGYSWDSNPWVWVIDFKLVGGEE